MRWKILDSYLQEICGATAANDRQASRIFVRQQNCHDVCTNQFGNLSDRLVKNSFKVERRGKRDGDFLKRQE